MQSPEQKWDAEDYSKNSSAQLQWARELIVKLDLKGDESILDVGCGDGKVTAELSLAVDAGSVLGIDLSDEMIRLATEKYPPSEYPRLSFDRMDATNIHLLQQFDIAFSNAVLQWVKDHDAVLRGVRACLKQGGRILFQMGGHGNAAGILAVIEKIMRHPRWQRYFDGFSSPYYFYGPAEYEAWLRSNSFHPVRVELVPKDMQHSIGGLAGWLRTTWFPYTDRLPHELRNAFLKETVEAYITDHPVDALGNVHVKMNRLEVEALAI